MREVKPCPECGGTEIYRRRYLTGQWDLGGDIRGFGFPELGGATYGAMYSMLVCRDCGHVRLFASEEARAKLAEAPGWTRMPVAEDA